MFVMLHYNCHTHLFLNFHISIFKKQTDDVHTHYSSLHILTCQTQDEDKQNEELPFCLYKSEIVLTAIIKGSIVHTALKFNVLC